MKKIFLYVMVAVSLVFAGSTLVAQPAFADAKSEICEGASLDGKGCTDNGVSIAAIAKNIVQLFAIVIGIVAVIMIMVGGFKYITSNGDSSSIASAKNTIVYALVGLVVAVSAQTIVWFVLNKVAPK